MKIFTPILILVLLPFFTIAQGSEPDCRAMIKKGDELLNTTNPQLQEVLRQYLNALNCDSKLSWNDRTKDSKGFWFNRTTKTK